MPFCVPKLGASDECSGAFVSFTALDAAADSHPESVNTISAWLENQLANFCRLTADEVTHQPSCSGAAIRHVTPHYVTIHYFASCTLCDDTLPYLTLPTLHCITLQYITLHHATLSYSFVMHITCIEVCYVTLQYKMLQLVTLHYNAPQLGCCNL